MTDPLENFIKENRQEFDDKEPTNRVWKGIYNKLNANEMPRLHWLWRAAAILFFITSSFMFYRLQLQQEGNLISSNQLTKEFENVESFYFQKISEKKEMIYDFEEINVTVDEAFEQDLQKLDAMYEVLKDELKNNPSKKVIDALILNLLVKVDILNKELQYLEDYASENAKEEDPSV